MEYELVKIENLSGKGASIYTLRPIDEENSLFDNFVLNNKTKYKEEVQDIYKRLKLIGQQFGLREQFIKINEGLPGDGVIALYDDPESNLRLYGIQYGKTLLIIGDGGFKPKSISRLQDDPKLKKENFLLRNLSAQITQRMRDKEIEINDDFTEFLGDNIFTIE